MEKSVINFKTLISSLLIIYCAHFESVLAGEGETNLSSNINQYGLGFDGLSLLPIQKPNLGVDQSFETELSTDKANSAEKVEVPPWQFEMNYLDKKADFFSPFHGFNTEYSQRLNNTSREYQTRMDYHFEHLTSQAALKFSPDSYGLGEYYNYELGVAIPVKNIFSLQTHYGWNRFDKKPEKGGMADYQDWSIGVSTNYRGMTLKLDYIDINASEDSEECGQSFPCEGKTVFSIIKNF